ncbi:MAG: class I SAM-dependent methyltransferase [Candidatus Omnitrophica bacterium]|nr:class I SAM-dependent methyltransferase [Candidatus Omnitrophota bacterium]
MYNKDYYENILFTNYKFTKERRNIFRFYIHLIREKKKDIKCLLDIGCAWGYFINVCEDEKISEIYGIDISCEALNEAKKYTSAKIYNIDISKEKSIFTDNYFDVITAIDVVEHIENDRVFLKEVYRILKKDGLFFIITPNPKSILRKIYLKIKRKDEDPTHINLQPVEYWQNLLKEIGFKKIEIKGCLIHGFPPFTELRDKLKGFFLIKPLLLPFKVGERFYIFARKL